MILESIRNKRSSQGNDTVRQDTNSQTESNTPSLENSWSNSLLAMIDKDKASESDCIEAFSHDNDSFNFALNIQKI